MRELSQRYWDAMIIRAWNRFDNCPSLVIACKYEFGAYPHELPLLRNKNCFGGVRAWVACELKPLSERLWITPKDRQIELLDWLGKTKLDCYRDKKTQKYGNEAVQKTYYLRKKLQQKTFSKDVEDKFNRNGSWKIVK